MMINFNDKIIKKLRNEYIGSEKKQTVILDDGNKYLLKFPDPIREEKKKTDISYINNAISEYIGCKIYKAIGLPVQEVILGEYHLNDKTKIACACKDLREQNEKMYEIETLELGSLDNTENFTFEYVEKLAGKIEGIIPEEFLDYFYKQFVADALIGNTDRHLGNCAIVVDEKENVRISPTFDCGSSLYPLVPDELLDNAKNKALGTYSAIRTKEGEKVNFHTAIASTENEYITKALASVLHKIDLHQISDIIDKVECISDKRKLFYKDFIDTNYHQTLLAGLEQRLGYKIPDVADKQKRDFYYQFYREDIERIRKIDEFVLTKVPINGNEIVIVKTDNNKAIVVDTQNDKCTAIFSLQSNNDNVEKIINTLEYIGVDTGLSIHDNRRELEERFSDNNISLEEKLKIGEEIVKLNQQEKYKNLGEIER